VQIIACVKYGHKLNIQNCELATPHWTNRAKSLEQQDLSNWRTFVTNQIEETKPFFQPNKKTRRNQHSLNAWISWTWQKLNWECGGTAILKQQTCISNWALLVYERD